MREALSRLSVSAPPSVMDMKREEIEHYIPLYMSARKTVALAAKNVGDFELVSAAHRVLALVLSLTTSAKLSSLRLVVCP